MRHPKGFIVAMPVLVALVVVALAAAGGSYWYAQSKKLETTNVNTAAVVNTNTDVAVNTNATSNTNVATYSNTNTAPDPTAGWMTYTSTQYHYSLKYPKDWRVSDFDPQYIRIIPPGGDYLNRQTASPSMQIDFIVVPGAIPVKTLTSPKKIIIDGKDAMQGIITGVPELFATQVSIDGDVLQIAWSKVNEFTDALNKVLSIFTFTNVALKTHEDDRLVRIRYPQQYTLEKITEQNRRGSFAAYNVVPQGTAPYLQELQLFSVESVKEFNEKCTNANQPCFFGDYPTVERFNGLRGAFEANKAYKDYSLETIGNEKYLIKNIVATGDGGFLREYNSFVGTTMVTFWVYIKDSSANSQADALVAPWVLEYSGF